MLGTYLHTVRSIMHEGGKNIGGVKTCFENLVLLRCSFICYMDRGAVAVWFLESIQQRMPVKIPCSIAIEMRA